MTSRTPINKGPIKMQVPFRGADSRSPSHSPDHEGPPLQEVVSEIRELVARSVTNGDACIKSLNEFGTSTANWNRQIFEQHVSDQMLQQELITTTQKLVNARVALQQETATCDALRQAVATERDKTNEMAIQLRIYTDANLGFVKVVSELSQALYNLTTLKTVASRGSNTSDDTF